MSGFDWREYLRKKQNSTANTKMEEEEKRNGYNNNGEFDWRRYLDKKESASKVRFDTFSDDFNAANSTIKSIYGGWQNKETMASTRSSVEEMYNRLLDYEDYRKTYGKDSDLPDLTEAATAYKGVLDDWDNISGIYNQYDSAESYNVALEKAKKEAEERAKREEEMRSADLGALHAEVIELQGWLTEATKRKEDARKKEDDYMDNTNYIYYNDDKRSKGRAGASLRNTDSYRSYMNQIGYESIEALEAALDEKNAYLKEATIFQGEYNALNAKDFKKYSDAGKSIKNPSYTDTLKTKLGPLEFGGEDIPNKLTFARDNHGNINASRNPEIADSPVPIRYLFANEDEINVYSYYLGLEKDGKVKKGTADAYLTSIDDSLKEREKNKSLAVTAEMADKLPILSSVASVLYTIPQAIEFGADFGKYVQTGEMDENTVARHKNVIRGVVSEKVDWEIAGFDAFDFAYNSGMSMLDSASTMWMPGGASLATMGMAAAGDGVNDALDRGLDDEHAFWNGIASGSFEMIFESFSLGNFKAFKDMPVDSTKGYIKNLAKTMLVNSSEEGLTEIANIVYDTLANGDLSHYELEIQKLVENGTPREEAVRKVAVKFGGQVVEAMGSGALMGFGFGNAGNISSAVRTNNLGKSIAENDRTTELLELSKSLNEFTPEESLAYETYEAYASKGITADNINTSQLGRLAMEARSDALEVLESNDSTSEEKAKAEQILADLDVYSQKTGYKSMESDIKREYKSSESVDALIESGLEGNEDSESYKLAKEYRAKLLVGQKLKESEIAKLYDAITKEKITETANEAKKKLTELGETNNVDKIADAISRRARGYKLTSAEAEMIENSEFGKQVLTEMSEDLSSDSAENVTTAEVSEKLTELGETAGNVAELSEIISKAAVGEKLSPTEAKTLEGSDYGKKVLAETSPEIAEAVEGMDEADAELFAEVYDGTSDIEYFKESFNLVKDLARANYTDDYILQNSGALSPRQVAQVYSKVVTEQRIAKQRAIDEAVKKYEGKLVRKANIDDSVFNGKNGQKLWRNLNSRQKQAITFVKAFAQGAGINLKITYNGKYNGKAYNGYYDHATNTIVIDARAGFDKKYVSEDAIIPTMSHELTHWMKQKSPELYAKLSKQIFDVFKAKGYTEYDLIATEKQKHPDMSDDAARDEIIARASEDLFKMSEEGKKIFDSLSEAEKKTLVGKIKELIQNLVDWANELLGLYESKSDEAGWLREFKDELSEIAKTWDQMLAQAVEVNAALEGEGTTGEALAKEITDAQLSEKETITQDAIDALRSIGRKSINKFTSEDIKKAEPFARRMFKELGVKSPFFRAWFGDWRVNDITPISPVEVGTIDLESVAMENGDYDIQDTKWTVHAGVTLKEETEHYARGKKVSVRALSAIKDILNNAILFDTEVSVRDSKNKALGTALMHKLYTPIVYGGKTYIAKVSVEEFLDTSTNEIKRKAYHLKGIKIETADGRAIEGNPTTSTSRSDTVSIKSISDLFQLVKTYDKEFNPKEASKVVNADGTPRIVYHQTGADFNIFDVKHKGAGTSDSDTPFGIFLKPTDEDIGLNGKKQMALYAVIKNPLEADNRSDLISKLKNLSEEYRNISKEIDEMNRNYSEREQAADKAVSEYLVEWRNKNPDASRTAIYEDARYNELSDEQDRIIEEWESADAELSKRAKAVLTNALKKAEYDGVHLKNDQGSFGRKTETFIALDPTQVKSATDNIGTFDKGNEDIQFSEKDTEGNTLSKAQIEFFKDSQVRDENGNLLVMYHGTPNGSFTEFRMGDGTHSSLMSAYGAGYYFDSVKASAKRYTKSVNKTTVATNPKVYEVHLNIKNPIRITDGVKTISSEQLAEIISRGNYEWFFTDGMPFYLTSRLGKTKAEIQKLPRNEIINHWAEMIVERAYSDADILSEMVKAYKGSSILSSMKDVLGNDGAAYKDKYGEIWVAWDSNQIKSVENQNPTSNPDINFSEKDTGTSAYDIIGEKKALEKRYNKLAADFANYKERVKLDKTLTKGKVIDPKQLEAVARYLVKFADSDYKASELAKMLNDLYVDIQDGAMDDSMSWDEMYAKAYEVAKEIRSEAKIKIERPALYDKILKDIRSARIAPNDGQKGDAKHRFGEHYVGKFRGRVTIANDGTPLDIKWSEWASKYPSVFDKDIGDAQQLVELYDIYDDLRNAGDVVQEYEESEMLQSLATEIINKAWTVTKFESTADKQNKRIQELNAEHRKAMEELKDTYTKKVSDAKLLEQMYYGKLLNQVQTKRKQEVSEAKAAGRERLAQYKENAERKVKMQSITNNCLTLNKWLVKNSKDEHIHETLKTPVINLLNAIDFSSKRMVNEGIPTNKDISLAKALGKVKDMMVKASNGHADFVQLYGHGLDEKIEKMMESIDAMDRTIADNEYVLQRMSLEDLDTLDKMVKTIKHAVSKLNKFHVANHTKGIAALSKASVEEMNSMGVNKVNTTLFWNNTLPYYAFKRYGEGGKIIFEAIQDGWDKFAFNVKEALDYAENAYTTKEVNEWEKGIKTFKVAVPPSAADLANPDYTPEYQTVQMTIPQIMSLYCLQKREQAKGHLIGGGIRVADFTIKSKIGKDKVVSQTDGAVITEKDIESIIGSLTARQKAVADKLQEFMNTVSTDWGNEVSMARFGYKAFGEENYFPIKSDDNNIGVDPTDTEASLFRLLNMSFTKGLTQGANNRVVISNIFDVFAQHVSDMAKYNALALPILDAFKWYNYTEKEAKGDEGAFKTIGVKQAIEKAFGKDGQMYFRTFLEDINGAKSVSRDTLGDGLLTKAKIASVGANLRVIALQPTSFLRASAILKPSSMLKASAYIKGEPIGMFSRLKKAIGKAEKYCGIALWKSLGYYDTNIQKGVADQIKHAETKMDKIRNASMKGAELADKATFGTLWIACEFEIRDTRKDLKVGSEEFYKEVGKKLREVIYATQVVDSTMTRSQMMRSSDKYDKLLTSFMSEATLSYNMLLDAAMDTHLDARKIGKKAAVKKNFVRMSRIAVAYTVTNAIAALVEAAFDTFRDDEDEEITFKKFKKFFQSNFLKDMGIIGKIPLLSDIVSIFEGYGSSNTTLAGFESIYYANESWKKVFTTADKGNPATAIKNSVKALSYLSGLPFYSVYRDFMSSLNKFKVLSPEEFEEILNDFLNWRE